MQKSPLKTWPTPLILGIGFRLGCKRVSLSQTNLGMWNRWSWTLKILPRRALKTHLAPPFSATTWTYLWLPVSICTFMLLRQGGPLELNHTILMWMIAFSLLRMEHSKICRRSKWVWARIIISFWMVLITPKPPKNMPIFSINSMSSSMTSFWLWKFRSGGSGSRAGQHVILNLVFQLSFRHVVFSKRIKKLLRATTSPSKYKSQKT